MKFGRNLPQFTAPEWSASYIKYKALKKLIKSAAEQVRAGQEADLAGKRDPVAVKRPARLAFLLSPSLTRIPWFGDVPHE